MSLFRRRRLITLIACVALAVGVGAGLALALGGGGGGAGAPRLPGAGPGAVSSVAEPAPAARLPIPRPTPFRPAPAAVRAAAAMPLPLAAAQLLVVSAPPSVPGAGGVVVERSTARGSGGVTAAAAAAVSAASAARAPAPFVALSEGDGGATAAAAVEAAARREAERLRPLGVNLVLAPAADVDVPGGALSGQLFSTDPVTVARLATAAVDGYLSAGVIPVVGHFPGEGAASADPDQQTASVGGSLHALQTRDLVPFEALAASAPVVIVSNASYTAFDGVTPASLLPAAVRLLRGQLRYPGVVMSGDLDAALQPTGLDPGAVALAGLRAGDDLLLITGGPAEQRAAWRAVLSAAERSPSVRTLVRAALVRDLSLKARFGLLSSGQ